MGELIPRPRPTTPLTFDGERFTTSFGGQTAIEHWHRYLMARELVRGSDVLDIACGEGYGSALLAQTARHVVGVDLSTVAIEHARNAYSADNLHYVQGSALKIPLNDAEVDVVISFETIEHFCEHEQFLHEIRRVLRPRGLAIISTPDRDNYSPGGMPANPFHRLELTVGEFNALLSRHFASVRVQGQRILLGSALLGGEAGDTAPLIFERRGENHFEMSSGPARAKYLVALATDGTLPALPDSVYVDSDRLLQIDGPALERIVAGHLPQETAERIAELEAKVGELSSYIAERDRANTELTAARGELEAKLTEFISYVAERDRIIAEGATVQVQLEAKLAEVSAQISERNHAIAYLEVQRAIARKASQRLAAEVGEAETERQQIARAAEAAKESFAADLAAAEAKQTMLERALSEANQRWERSFGGAANLTF